MMGNENKGTCHSCAWFNTSGLTARLQFPLTRDEGRCFLNPPQLDHKNQSQAHPVVKASCYCSHHRESALFRKSVFTDTRRIVAGWAKKFGTALDAQDGDIPALRLLVDALLEDVSSENVVSMLAFDAALIEVCDAAKALVVSGPGTKKVRLRRLDVATRQLLELEATEGTDGG